MLTLLLLVGCGEKAATCEENGTNYSEGESWQADDGCNTCACTQTGEVICTLMDCSPTDEPDTDSPPSDTDESDDTDDTDDTSNSTDTASSDAEDPEDTGGSEPVNCWNLDATTCATTSECEVIMASPVAYNNECFVWANTVEAVGCMPSGMGCTMALTYRRADRSSGCYGFTSGCTPLDWEPCDPANAPECR